MVRKGEIALDSNTESKLLMIVVDSFRDRIVNAVTAGEAFPTPQERVQHYRDFVVDLSGGDRIKSFLARLALIGEGADAASVAQAADGVFKQTDALANSNHYRILQNLNHAVDQPHLSIDR